MKRSFLFILIVLIGLLSISAVASADYDGFSIELKDNDYLNLIITLNDTFDIYSNSYSDLYVIYCNYSVFGDIDLIEIANDKIAEYGFGNLETEDNLTIAENLNSSLPFKYAVLCNSSDEFVVLAGNDLAKLKEIAKTIKLDD